MKNSNLALALALHRLPSTLAPPTS